MKTLVITAAGANLQTLYEALAGVGVDDVQVLSSHVTDRMLDDHESTFVVGVLGSATVVPTHDGDEASDAVRAPGFVDTDVMLRIGRQIEQGFQTLVIVPPPLPVPAPAAGLVVAPCPVSDLDSLSLHLWAFVSSISSRPRAAGQSATSARRPPALARLKSTIRLLKSLKSVDPSTGARVTGFQLENLVLQLLHYAGAEVAERPRLGARDEGFDAALIPHDDSKDIFLVEVAAGHLDRRRLAERAQRLQRAVITNDSALGLLIYKDDDNRRFEPEVIPAVIMMAADDLAERLENASLTQIVSEEIAAVARQL